MHIQDVQTYKPARRGVYFLANDAVIDIAIAFLNSFRINNPFIELCLIPFDDDFSELSKLKNVYEFSIFDDQEKLHKCDEISMRFFRDKKSRGHFRKFCTFEGIFDEFIYIDCDTIILKDLYFTFQYLSAYDIVFSHSDIPKIRKWVWKDSAFSVASLTSEQINFAANTGFFCSRYRAISLGQAWEYLDAALAIVDHMELHCVEQPFLNFLVVALPIRRTSLLNLKRLAPYRNIPLELWAAGAPEEWRYKWPGRAESEDVLLIHWAGCWMSSEGAEVDSAQPADISKHTESRSASRSMPRRALWEYYRALDYRALTEKRSIRNLIDVAEHRRGC